MSRHPIQPLEMDDKGVLRFKVNAIVRHLLDHGGIDLNKIAMLRFSREDQEQFAQLIGYSHSGAYDLGYMSGQVLDAAQAMFDGSPSEAEARLEVVENRLAAVQEKLRDGVAELYGVHPGNEARQ